MTLVHVDPATDRPTPYLNFVCEIPKFSRKKFEIATDEVGNFIKQDEKKGVLREVRPRTRRPPAPDVPSPLTSLIYQWFVNHARNFITS